MAIVELDFVKSYLNILDTTLDIKITALIPKVEEDYLNVRKAPYSIVNDVLTYPIGSDVTATEMIAFKLATSGTYQSVGRLVQSETIDSYRISYGTSLTQQLGGYPKSITSSIKRFAIWQ